MQSKSPPASDGDEAASACEHEVLRSLRRIIRAVDIYSRKLMTQHGLSSPQLMCLRELDTDGSMPTGQLAKSMHLSAATVCGILDRLEARGLVTRQRQTDDKRLVIVELSADGRRLVRAAPPLLQESFSFKLRALPRSRQAEINKTLKQVVAMMAAEGLDAAPMLLPGDSVTQSGPGTTSAPASKG